MSARTGLTIGLPHRANPRDRREDRRYPASADVTYHVVDGESGTILAGTGRTVNISAGGVLFDSGRQLPVGSAIELSVAWPGRVGETAVLKLWAAGEIVRSAGNRTAVRVMQYEFRARRAVTSVFSGEIQAS
jgi:hypothetical protein